MRKIRLIKVMPNRQTDNGSVQLKELLESGYTILDKSIMTDSILFILILK